MIKGSVWGVSNGGGGGYIFPRPGATADQCPGCQHQYQMLSRGKFCCVWGQQLNQLVSTGNCPGGGGGGGGVGGGVGGCPGVGGDPYVVSRMLAPISYVVQGQISLCLGSAADP